MARKKLKDFGVGVPEFSDRSTGETGQGIDPEILRALAKKKKQGRLLARTKQVPQREPERSPLSAKSQTLDPRQRAAMLMQQKIRQGMSESAAPDRKKKKKKQGYNV